MPFASTMFESPRQEDVPKYVGLACDTSSLQLSTPQTSQPLPPAASPSDTTSPALSLFSKAHTTKSGSNASSIASSPALRDSFEVFTSSKRLLTDVKEEPLEREDAEVMDTLSCHSGKDQRSDPIASPLDQSNIHLPSAADYNFREYDTADVAYSASFKKRRSEDSPGSAVPNRFGTRFPSFSRKWKTKTGASPKLSIITDSDGGRSRTNSASSQLVSPALSAISKHESLLCSPPAQTAPEQGSNECSPGPIDIGQSSASAEEDQAQVTTPLLPPIMIDLSSKNPILQSPLQSPTVAETPSLPSSATPSGTPQLSSLPSPPLSTKPSITSIRQRSRAGTVVASSEISSLQMLGEDNDDEWSAKLGHANFTIHPEPYLPCVFDMETLQQLRENWDQARHNYAKHLARTGEHYGTTSKTYLLTEQKWALVDTKWKKNNAAMADVLGPLMIRASGGDTAASDSASPSTVREQHLTKVVVPQISHPSGKFPDMGDEDIVGPMAVGPARAQTMHQFVEPAMQSRMSTKRNFLKFISDILGRGGALGPRT